MPRGGFGRRGFGGRGFGMRRFGAPLMPMGMGMGMGSPLLTTLMAGGLGYALGSNAAQQAAKAPQAQQAPPYQPYALPGPTCIPARASVSVQRRQWQTCAAQAARRTA